MIIEYNEEITEEVCRGIHKACGCGCAVCGTPSEFSNSGWELIVPELMGGTITRDNIMPVCTLCRSTRKGLELPPSRYKYRHFNKTANSKYIRTLMENNVKTEFDKNNLILENFNCYIEGGAVYVGLPVDNYYDSIIKIVRNERQSYNIMTEDNEILTIMFVEKKGDLLELDFAYSLSTNGLRAISKMLFYIYPVLSKYGIKDIKLNNIIIPLRNTPHIMVKKVEGNSAYFDTNRAIIIQ